MYWVHASGEDNDGKCLACILERDGWEYHPDGAATVKAHDAQPDTDSMDDDIWCWICGHDIEKTGGLDSSKKG